jgi:hypothetical protein
MLKLAPAAEVSGERLSDSMRRGSLGDREKLIVPMMYKVLYILYKLKRFSFYIRLFNA